jgi:O-antigen/teichoic acid export membrane protein
LKSRTSNTLKNTAFAVLAQILTQILGFVSRTIFIYYLGIEYLGVSGLFSNILSFLSLAELGIGSAIVYNMYKPIADNNELKVKQLINFYKKAYRYIIIALIGIGISIIPFMDLIIKEKPNVTHLTLIYLLYLAGTISTYFVAHKRSFIIADQKDYVNTLNKQIFSFVQIVVDIVVLVLTQNFILYLSLRVLITMLSNWRLSYIVDKLYPNLIDTTIAPLEKKERKNIFKHIRAMMYHSIGGVIVFSTDNILISAFIGIVYVGIYSNYLLIIGVLVTVIGMFFNSAIASVGNLNATSDSKKSYAVFKRMFFLNAVAYSVVTICLYVLINDFIILWLGDGFLLDKWSVILIVINFYIMNVRNIVLIFRNTTGLFYKDRYRPLLVAVVNLGSSIFLLNQIGIIGVFLGTFISTAGITLWMEPLILFKYGFKLKLVEYFKEYVKFIFVIIFAITICLFLDQMFLELTWFTWVLKAIITIVISMFIVLLFFYKSDEYKFWLNFIKQLIKI